jgi:hypothetical protein
LAPGVTSYTDEQALQSLIQRSPNLAAGSDDLPMVVATEVQIPSVGSADLVAVNTSGEVTLVECKLHANTEIRRHVVGQLFAYAAGPWQLSYEEFDETFSARAGGPIADLLAGTGVEASDEEIQAIATQRFDNAPFAGLSSDARQAGRI